MHMVCLDLEGVLVPEIWIEFSRATGIDELKVTTRDEPDYGKLMRFRIGMLKQHGLRLVDIQKTIGTIRPLPGAAEFVSELRSLTQLVILSDTFTQFAQPLMAQLAYPTIFCNELIVDGDGTITDFRLRQPDGKRHSVEALKALNFRVFASGDSYNDLAMIKTADAGALFRAPQAIKADNPKLACVEAYEELLATIREFMKQEE
jgi:phosphoserine / homoserine phosphotransferase